MVAVNVAALVAVMSDGMFDARADVVFDAIF